MRWAVNVKSDVEIVLGDELDIAETERSWSDVLAGLVATEDAVAADREAVEDMTPLLESVHAEVLVPAV